MDVQDQQLKSLRSNATNLSPGSSPAGDELSAIGEQDYHDMSKAHLGRHCAEFNLRYNTRDMNDGERAALILRRAEGRRLTYRRADKLAA